MANVKNTSQAMRVVNVILDGRAAQVTLLPGRTAEVDELVDTVGSRAAVKAGHLTVDEADKQAPVKPTKAKEGEGSASANQSPAKAPEADPKRKEG